MKIVTEAEEWDRLLENNFNNDFYFRHAFHSLFDGKVEAIYWEDDEIKVFWPHLVKEIPLTDYFDCSSPYGFTGPLIKGNSVESLNSFFAEYQKYAKEKNYVSEYIRFNPFLKNDKVFTNLFPVFKVNRVVVVDLTQPLDKIKAELSKTTKRYVNKSKKLFPKVKFVESPNLEEIKTFTSLYLSTMKKHQLPKKFFFNHNFIKDHFNLSCFLSFCENQEGEVGSSVIMLKGHEILHYHLGCTNYKFKCSPLRLMLWEAILYGKKNGFKYLNLGGGGSEDDALLKFKSGFSSLNLPFHVGNIIFNQEVYNKLVSPPRDNRRPFPEYRTTETII